MGSGCPFDPPPDLKAIAAEGPVHKVRLWDSSTPWLVTRHADQRTLLRDPRISADGSKPGYPSPATGSTHCWPGRSPPTSCRRSRCRFRRWRSASCWAFPMTTTSSSRSTALEEPADDLLSELTGYIRSGEISLSEAVQMSVLLLFAGHETTANMIALGTLAFLEHPGQLALADIEFQGQVIKAGDGVIMPNDIGNRDPDVFTDPDKLDITRDAKNHLAFQERRVDLRRLPAAGHLGLGRVSPARRTFSAHSQEGPGRLLTFVTPVS